MPLIPSRATIFKKSLCDFWTVFTHDFQKHGGWVSLKVKDS